MLPLRRWKILNEETRLPVIEVILKNRNLSLNHLEKFKLSERLHDPFLLTDMDRCVERVVQAIDKKEVISIFGDYDVDGIVSTVLMVKFFEKIGLSVNYFIPDRNSDGYGLKENNIKEIKKCKTNLLITVDNGISSIEAIDLANEYKIDVLVIDHHIQKGKLPNAHAIVNPNRIDCSYPFKGLCGAGLVYKLFQAIGKYFFSGDEYKNFMLAQLDLVAFATIADIVPVVDENYAILKFGLKSLNNTLRPGLVELKRVSNLLGKEITPVSVGYYLAPRVNASGRIKDATLSVKLLLSKTNEQAAFLAGELNRLNMKRQQLQDKFINQTLDAISEEYIYNNRIIMVENEECDQGLVGLIAGKLKEKYSRPAIVFTKDKNGNYVGSARSIETFHITNALENFSNLILHYGGHDQAAGLTVTADKFPQFKAKFTEFVNSTISKNELVPDLIIDSIIGSDQLNFSTIQTIREIGPFGEGNPEPIFLIKNVLIKEIYELSQGKHLKIFIQADNQRYECVWWGKGEVKDIIKFDNQADIVFKPTINIWNGRSKLQLSIEDMKIS